MNTWNIYFHNNTFISKQTILFFSFFFFLQVGNAHEPLTLTCPQNILLQPDPCSGGAFLDYSLIEWSSSTVLVDTVLNPAPGTLLEPGVYPASIVATDIDGNVEVCGYLIEVENFSTFPICENNVMVDLEGNCEMEVTWEMIILETWDGCGADLWVELSTSIGEQVPNTPFVDFELLGENLVVTVTDSSTNQNCWAQLTIQNSTPPTIICPIDLTIFCHESPAITRTGPPVTASCYDNVELSISKFDNYQYSTCPDNVHYTLNRTWQVTDPQGLTSNCMQVITAVRFSLEDVDLPPNYDNIDQPALNCQDSFSFEMLSDTSQTGVPTVNGLFADEIACDFSTLFNDTLLHICGSSYQIKRRWQIVDWCSGDVIEEVQTILIQDVMPPEFTAPDTIWVSLDGDCTNEVYFPPIEMISECSGYSVEVVTPWETLSENGGFLAVDLAFGIYEGNYLVMDSCGNLATKNFAIVMENEVLLECPADLTLTCNEYNEQIAIPMMNGEPGVLQNFGSPIFYANCPFVVNETASFSLDSCLEGSIQRVLATSNTNEPIICTQQIAIEHISDFVVEFPIDIMVECGSTPPDTGVPIIYGGDCENIQISKQDQIFDLVPDACYKIVRTWTVINTCLYDSNIGNVVFETAESELSVFSNCDLNGENGCNNFTFKDGLTIDNFPNATPDGIIVYVQVIKVNDNIPPMFDPSFDIPNVCIEGSNCSVTLELPLPEILECSEVTITGISDLGSGLGPFENVVPGSYNVSYLVQDNCGNSNALQAQVTVEDCQAPSAFCKNGLSIELELANPPTVSFLAADLDAGSNDNCSSLLHFSFSDNPNDGLRTYTCDDIGAQVVQLWVTDEAGNQAFCENSILVQDPFSACGSNPVLTGGIWTEEDEGVAQVEVTIKYSDGSEMLSLTDLGGQYSFTSMPNVDVTITPYKDIFQLNGVSTFDIVLVTKHILGVQMLDSPYKLIAADVNNSGTITTFDLVEMRRMVLQSISHFTGNTSWRFVPESFEFPNPENPFESPFPESTQFSIGDIPDLNFIGIKIGDVNNSADPAQ